MPPLLPPLLHLGRPSPPPPLRELLARLLLLLLAAWPLQPLQARPVAGAPAALQEPPPILEEGQIFRPTLGRRFLASSADPQATQAGLQVLRDGGNAVDAAVTMALVEAVTLPRAGNLGGGGFLLLREPGGAIQALDFRETAPALASRDMFLDTRGEVDRRLATEGYRCAGVPGTVAGLAAALARHGTLTWAQAIEPARALAEEGFLVPEALARDIARAAPRLARHPSSARIYLPGGRPLQAGSRWRQPALAWTLARLQGEGPDALYGGVVGQRLVKAVKEGGGLISLDDLRGYQAVWRAPIRGGYRGYEVWSMPPPSSGGVHLIQMLRILEGYPLTALGQNSAATLHRMAEAMRTAYADRSRWLGDPDFVHNPVEALISPARAAQVRASIPVDRARSSQEVGPASLPGYESDETTHLSVVDSQGGAVALTYTLNFSFGSGAVAEGTGILLNNELDDFSAAPGAPNAFGLTGGAHNAIAPGKRPLSSMAPTLVTREGRLVAALGSPGGPRIITTVLQVLINLIDFDLNAQEAVSRPRIHHPWLPDRILYEAGISPDTLDRLAGYGHSLERVDASGHAAIVRVREDGVLEGGIDPRRPGAAAGE